MPVLETDFLLGLRKNDRKYSLCTKVLEAANQRKAPNLRICASAFIEIGVGLRGRISRTEIIDTLRSLKAMTLKVDEVPLCSSVLLAGLEIEDTLSTANLFDCLHAASALSLDGIIASDDKFFEHVPGLKRTSLSALLSNINEL